MSVARSQPETDQSEPYRGFRCPSCGCAWSEVVRTQACGTFIRRQRRCRYCGQTRWTTERNEGE